MVETSDTDNSPGGWSYDTLVEYIHDRTGDNQLVVEVDHTIRHGEPYTTESGGVTGIYDISVSAAGLDEAVGSLTDMVAGLVAEQIVGALEHEPPGGESAVEGMVSDKLSEYTLTSDDMGPLSTEIQATATEGGFSQTTGATLPRMVLPWPSRVGVEPPSKEMLFEEADVGDPEIEFIAEAPSTIVNAIPGVDPATARTRHPILFEEFVTFQRQEFTELPDPVPEFNFDVPSILDYDPANPPSLRVVAENVGGAPGKFFVRGPGIQHTSSPVSPGRQSTASFDLSNVEGDLSIVDGAAEYEVGRVGQEPAKTVEVDVPDFGPSFEFETPNALTVGPDGVPELSVFVENVGNVAGAYEITGPGIDTRERLEPGQSDELTLTPGIGLEQFRNLYRDEENPPSYKLGRVGRSPAREIPLTLGSLDPVLGDVSLNLLNTPTSLDNMFTGELSVTEESGNAPMDVEVLGEGIEQDFTVPAGETATRELTFDPREQFPNLAVSDLLGDGAEPPTLGLSVVNTATGEESTISEAVPFEVEPPLFVLEGLEPASSSVAPGDPLDVTATISEQRGVPGDVELATPSGTDTLSFEGGDTKQSTFSVDAPSDPTNLAETGDVSLAPAGPGETNIEDASLDNIPLDNGGDDGDGGETPFEGDVISLSVGDIPNSIQPNETETVDVIITNNTDESREVELSGNMYGEPKMRIVEPGDEEFFASISGSTPGAPAFTIQARDLETGELASQQFTVESVPQPEPPERPPLPEDVPVVELETDPGERQARFTFTPIEPFYDEDEKRSWVKGTLTKTPIGPGGAAIYGDVNVVAATARLEKSLGRYFGSVGSTESTATEDSADVTTGEWRAGEGVGEFTEVRGDPGPPGEHDPSEVSLVGPDAGEVATITVDVSNVDLQSDDTGNETRTIELPGGGERTVTVPGSGSDSKAQLYVEYKPVGDSWENAQRKRVAEVTNDDSSPGPWDVAIEGLNPDGKYRYRAVLETKSGNIYGDTHEAQQFDDRILASDSVRAPRGEVNDMSLEWDSVSEDVWVHIRLPGSDLEPTVMHQAAKNIPLFPFLIPDFIVENINIDAAGTVAEGINVAFDVYNAGSQGAFSVTGPGVDTGGTLAQGERETIETTIQPDSPGIRTLEYEITNEQTGDVESFTKSVNIGSVEEAVISLADVTAPEEVEVGESFDVVADVQSGGGKPVEYAVSFVGDEQGGTLDPNETASHTFPVTADNVGELTEPLTLTNETEGVVEEERDVVVDYFEPDDGSGGDDGGEDDDDGDEEADPADFAITSSDSPSSVVEGDRFDVSVTIENEGGQAGEAAISSGEKVQEMQLEPGESSTVSFTYQENVPGPRVYAVVVENVDDGVADDTVTEQVVVEPDVPDRVPDPEPPEEGPIIIRPDPPEYEPPDYELPQPGDGEPYDGPLTYLDPLGLFGTTRQIPTLNEVLGEGE
jgi:hypothetical protein